MTTSNTPTPSGPSRTSTPNPATASRFTAQSHTAEDLLKTQTVGLVHLSDFRKRRAEALEQKEREAQDRSLGRYGSGTATPASDGARTPLTHQAKKKKRKLATGKLSFGDALGDEESEAADSPAEPAVASNGGATPVEDSKPQPASRSASPKPERKKRSTSADLPTQHKKRLGPASSIPAPIVMTKSALQAEAATREQLRREFLALQDLVKATPIAIPFVFYDGTNIPGGVCKVKKGDHTWLFLDKARKVGAELGVAGGVGGMGGDRGRREWARVGVDDLMMVRGEIIVPHHYEFYYFIVNKNRGPNGALLFDFSSQSPAATKDNASSEPYNPIFKPTSKSATSTTLPESDLSTLEGATDDPNITKVVDRRWYERNKHIFPASVWEEFDPEKDYTKAVRRDGGGNAFFFR